MIEMGWFFIDLSQQTTCYKDKDMSFSLIFVSAYYSLIALHEEVSPCFHTQVDK